MVVSVPLTIPCVCLLIAQLEATEASWIRLESQKRTGTLLNRLVIRSRLSSGVRYPREQVQISHSSLLKPCQNSACKGCPDRLSPVAQTEGTQNLVVKYRFRRTKDSRWAICFETPPSYLHALPMAAQKMEDKLKRGTWLVLAVGVFSARDLRSIELASQCVRNLRGRGINLQLGVRPFWEYKEMNAWLPDYNSNSASPVWVVIQDGNIVRIHSGGFESLKGEPEHSELKKWLERALSVKSKGKSIKEKE